MKNKILILPVLRRIMYILLTLAAFILQFTIIPKTGIPVSFYLLIPVCISISMFEKEFSGLFFGLIAGALWDLASPLTDGFLALVFAVICCLAGLLTHYLLRNTLLTAIILSLTASVLYTLILQFYFIESFSIDLFSKLLQEHYLPPVIITAVLTVPVYFLVRQTAIHFHGEQFNRGL